MSKSAILFSLLVVILGVAILAFLPRTMLVSRADVDPAAVCMLDDGRPALFVSAGSGESNGNLWITYLRNDGQIEVRRFTATFFNGDIKEQPTALIGSADCASNKR